jgi:HK97 family phage major capsid protein
MLASSFNSGAIQPEGTTVDDGDDVVFGQANLAAFTYPTGVLKVSIPVEDDSSVVTIRSAITAYASEVIGRRLSPLSVSGTGLGEPCGVMTVAETVGAWSAGKSGGYIALDAATPVTIDGTATTELIAGIPAPSTLLKMVGAVNAAYRDDNCKWYCSTDQYIALCSITDDDGNPLILPNGPRVLHGFPIAIADELPALQSGNVGGPVFGNLSAGMYMRDAGYSLLRLVDRFADALQVGYLGWGRYDFRARDVRAFVTVKGNSS